MQLRLLNFYKFLANLANNLVGAFVPLIIFKATNSLAISFLYMACQSAVRLLVSFFLRKQMRQRPQLFLLFRILTLTIYNAFVLILDLNILIGAIGICIFLGTDTAFRSSANEYIYNYSSLNKGSGTLGLSRLFEQMGTIASLIIGGILLDFNKTLVVIIALVLYTISIAPLLVYYIKSRKSTLFNKEATSNAIMHFTNNEKASNTIKILGTKTLLCYAILYFCYSMVDIKTNIFNLHLFITSNSTFSIAGIFSAIYNGFFGVGSWIVGKIEEKHDTLRLVQLSAVIMGVAVILLPFVNNFITLYILFGLSGLVHPFISLFSFQRLLLKSRILGISNRALLTRELSAVFSYIVGYSFGLLTTTMFNGSLVPTFIIIGLLLFYTAYYIPRSEEKTRKYLVDYLQQNEYEQNAKEDNPCKGKKREGKKKEKKV